MRQWAILFGILSAVCATLGFAVLSGELASLAQFLFVVFFVLLLAAVIFDNRELNY